MKEDYKSRTITFSVIKIRKGNRKARYLPKVTVLVSGTPRLLIHAFWLGFTFIIRVGDRLDMENKGWGKGVKSTFYTYHIFRPIIIT